MDGEPAVDLKGISKSFGGGVQAADDVSFHIGKGEFCTLLGPSGCGKSTTLRIVAGFELPDRGTLTINGVDCTRVPAHRRDTAMVFQGYALFPHRTVLQNVSFGLRMRRLGRRREIERRAREALELVGLADLADRHPGQLSGGQQQRVALARAIVLRPSVLLLDEPLSALDLKLRRQMRFELKRLQSEIGLTTIFVTHDQEEAMSLSDKVVVMNGGRIEQIGSPDEIYNRPASRFVGDFIGELNIFPGRVSAFADVDHATVRLDAGGCDVACRLTQGRGRSGLQPGDLVAVIVRASDIDVLAPNADAIDGMPGTVIQHAFVGATRRYYIRPHGADMVVIADLPANLPAPSAATGDIRFAWKPDAAILVRQG